MGRLTTRQITYW